MTENKKGKTEEGTAAYFINKMFYRMLAPSLFSAFGLMLGNIVDALVVGAKMGEAGLAAIGLAYPVYMVFNTIHIGLGVGGSIYYTRFLSQGKAEEGMELFNRIIFFALIISGAIAVSGNVFLDIVVRILGASPDAQVVYSMTKEYAGLLLSFAPLFFLNFILYHFVRCDDNANLAAAGLVLGNITDIFLSYWFVIVMGYGIIGAALSVIIGSAVSIAVYIPHFLLRHTNLRLKLVRPELESVVKAFKTGYASSSKYIYTFVTFIVLNHLMMRRGGETGIAVLNIITNISLIAMSVFEGIEETLQPLVSTFYGEKDQQAIEVTMRLSAQQGIFLGIIFTAAIFIGAEPLSLIFGLRESDSIAIGTEAIRAFCPGILAGGANIIVNGYFQAVDKERLSFYIYLLRYLILLLGFSLLFLFFGLDYFWLAFPATEITTMILWIFYCVRKKIHYPLEVAEKKRVYSMMICNKSEDLSNVIAEIEEFCEFWEADPAQSYYVVLAVEEICGAIMQNAFGKGGLEYIQLTLAVEDDKTFVVHLRDSFSFFNPFRMNTQKIKNIENDEAMDAIGVLVVKSKAKSFFYRRYQGFNTLVIKV